MNKLLICIAMTLSVFSVQAMEKKMELSTHEQIVEKTRLETEIKTLLIAHKFLIKYDMHIGCDNHLAKKRIKPLVIAKIENYVTLLESESSKNE